MHCVLVEPSFVLHLQMGISSVAPGFQLHQSGGVSAIGSAFQLQRAINRQKEMRRRINLVSEGSLAEEHTLPARTAK